MTSPNDTLADIILRAKAGDRDAFGVVYQTYVTPIYRYALARVHNADDAEDIVQDTFLRAYQALDRYTHDRDSMLPYLFTIARNVLINKGRKKQPEVYAPGEVDRHAGGYSASKMATDGELSRELQEAMETLTDMEREVVALRFFGERSYEEISSLLDKEQDAIRQHVARAMKKMRISMNKRTPS